MTDLINHPRVFSIGCLFLLWLVSRCGVWLRSHLSMPATEDKLNLGFVVSATLTLLGLVIGFTFSMASTRYDQRRLYEEGEANAIGTEYVRAALLPPADAQNVRRLLQVYLRSRLDFYQSDYGVRLTRVDAQTSALQTQLWTSILPQAAATPTPVTALVVSGMNDVLNSQGYTQFSWWNRIPTSAWSLLIAIAVFANLLIGYAAERPKVGNLLLLVIPLIVSVSFFLVADLDSPRGGVIKVAPVDLINLSQSLHD